MLPPEKPPEEQAQPRGRISPPLFGPLLPALFCLRSHVLRRDRWPTGDLLAVMIGVLSHALASYPPRSLRHHGLCAPSCGPGLPDRGSALPGADLISWGAA